VRGWPEDGKMTIKWLAKTRVPAHNKFTKVELLGHNGKLKIDQITGGLAVELPNAKLSDPTRALRITDSNLNPAPQSSGM
jgi:hypothetical protein